MAKVQTIVIKNPFGGMIPTLAGTGTAIPNAGMEGSNSKNGEQYTYGNAISLFRLEKLGHVAPGHIFSAATDASNFVTEKALNADVDSNSKAWVILRNMRLLAMDTTSPAVTAKYDPTMSGAHSGHALGTTENPDILVLKDLAATPVEYVLWTFEDNTDADVALIKTDGSGENDAFFSGLSGGTVLKKGVPLKMGIGPDGAVYITNGSSAAQISITGAIASATATPTKLNFGPGWTATGVTAMPWKGYIVFIGSKTIGSFQGLTRGAVRIWFYNGSDTNYTTSYDIPDNYGNGIYSDGANLWALTNGRNNSSKQWRFNGTEFVKENETTQIGVSSTPIQGGMEGYQDSLLVGTTANSQGKLFRFFRGGMHNDAVISDGTFEASSVGMVKNLSQANLFFGVQYGSGPTYKIFYQASFTQYYTPADFRTRLYEIGIDASIIGGRIYFSQFGTGASVLLSLFKGYDTLSIGGATDKLNKTISYAVNGALKGYRFKKMITKVSSFYMNWRFNHASVTNTAAIIERVEIDWIPNVQ